MRFYNCKKMSGYFLTVQRGGPGPDISQRRTKGVTSTGVQTGAPEAPHSRTTPEVVGPSLRTGTRVVVSGFTGGLSTRVRSKDEDGG